MPVNHGANARGNRDQNQVEPSKIYKNRKFGTLELDRTDVGNPAREGVLPSYLTPSSRHLGRRVTDSSMMLAFLVHLEPQDSPLFSPLSTCSSCFANTLKHTHTAGRSGGLRQIRHKHHLLLRHFAARRSRTAHNKSSCLARHDVTVRQKRGHRRIPQRKSGDRRSPFRCNQYEGRPFERMLND